MTLQKYVTKAKKTVNSSRKHKRPVLLRRNTADKKIAFHVIGKKLDVTLVVPVFTQPGTQGGNFHGTGFPAVLRPKIQERLFPGGTESLRIIPRKFKQLHEGTPVSVVSGPDHCNIFRHRHQWRCGFRCQPGQLPPAFRIEDNCGKHGGDIRLLSGSKFGRFFLIEGIQQSKNTACHISANEKDQNNANDTADLPGNDQLLLPRRERLFRFRWRFLCQGHEKK